MKTIGERRAESARALQDQQQRERLATSLRERAREQRRWAVAEATTVEALREAVLAWIDAEENK